MPAAHRHRTALVIPVPGITAGRSADARAASPAITLVDPFLPAPAIDEGVLAELEDFFGSLTPFDYTLGEPTRFPDGVTYLPPQPLAPFRRIVAGLRADFPEVAWETTLESVAPHLLPWPEDARDVAPAAPARAVARQVLLLGGVELEAVLATFSFGTSAA